MTHKLVFDFCMLPCTHVHNVGGRKGMKASVSRLLSEAKTVLAKSMASCPSQTGQLRTQNI